MITDLSITALRAISQRELSTRLGLTERGVPSLHGLAQLLRLAARRWRVTRRRDLVRYGDAQIAACGLEAAFEGGAAPVVDALVGLRDLEVAREGGREVLLAAGLRLVAVTEELGLLTGAAEEPAGLEIALRPDGVPRWIALDAQQRRAVVDAGGRVWSLREWLGLPGLRPVGDAEVVAQWEAISAELMARAGPIVEPARWVVLVGEPGGYFGRHQRGDGRWVPGDADLPDGLWIAASPGYSEHHWHPSLVQVVEGVPHRAAHVANWSVAYDLCRARGVAVGAREVLRVGDGELRQTCPMPARVQGALAAALRRDGWRFTGPTAATEALADLLCGDLWLRRAST